MTAYRKSNTVRTVGFRVIVSYVTPYTTTLVFAALLMLGSSLIALISPWFAGQIASFLLQNTQPLGLGLNIFILLWIVVLAVQALLSFANQYVAAHVGEQMLANLRMRLYEHLQSLPLSYFNDRKHGEVLSLITNDAEIISGFVTGTLLNIVPQLAVFLGAIVMITIMDPTIGLMIGILLPVFFIVVRLIGRNIAPVTQAMVDQYASNFSLLEQNLQMLPAIKSFTREHLETERFHQSNQSLLRLTQRYQRIQAALTPTIQFLASSGILLLVLFSTNKILNGELGTSELVSILLYSLLLTRPLSGLAGIYGEAMSTKAAANRLIAVFNAEPEPFDTEGRVLQNVDGHLEIDKISFHYPGRPMLFDGLSVAILPGKTCAITGPNGVGKSTLMHLLMRFISPEKGEIRIDGIPLQKISLRSLRSQIGIVHQQLLILNGSIRDNILFGRQEATESELIEAARASHAIDFIQQLPEGMDTIVGDNGIKLSGGQKQRLALARALLKDPKILILDEPTAMFDPDSESQFVQECQNALKGKTVILITHRPASLALADQIFQIP